MKLILSCSLTFVLMLGLAGCQDIRQEVEHQNGETEEQTNEHKNQQTNDIENEERHPEYKTDKESDIEHKEEANEPSENAGEDPKVDGQRDVGEEEGIPNYQDPDDILVLVNKDNFLPEDYVPQDLIIPDVLFSFEEEVPKKQLREEAALALEELFEAAEEDLLELFAVSGYRSYDRQEAIFASNVEQHGEEEANQFSARAGESEHQTGLVMDVTSPQVDFRLTTEFGETEEGQWLKEHAAEYGFIIRYPQGKEHITGYQYEPWHLRYVGQAAAVEIMGDNLTLEEYLGEA